MVELQQLLGMIFYSSSQLSCSAEQLADARNEKSPSGKQVTQAAHQQHARCDLDLPGRRSPGPGSWSSANSLSCSKFLLRSKLEHLQCHRYSWMTNDLTGLDCQKFQAAMGIQLRNRKHLACEWLESPVWIEICQSTLPKDFFAVLLAAVIALGKSWPMRLGKEMQGASHAIVEIDRNPTAQFAMILLHQRLPLLSFGPQFFLPKMSVLCCRIQAGLRGEHECSTPNVTQ